MCVFGHTQWLAHLGDVQDIARLELSCQEWNVRIPAMPCRTVAKGPQVGSIASRMPRRSIQCNPVLRIRSKEAVTSATESCNVLYRVARCTAAIIVIYLGHVSKSTCSVLTGESPYLPQSTDCNAHSTRRVLTREMPSQAAPQCSAEMQRRPLDACAVRAECAVATTQCRAVLPCDTVKQFDSALLCSVSSAECCGR